MFYSLCDLVIEHLGAIILLAKTGQHYGSAFAILRPLMETCIRAFWVLYIAEDDALISIAKRQQEFPGFESARSSLEHLFQKIDVKLFHIDKAVVNTIHGFTHSGMEQIVHRYGTDRGIVPEYREKDILELLNQAARFSVMAAVERIQQIEGEPDKPSPKAAKLVREFSLIAEN
jgi:hypothetical protein